MARTTQGCWPPRAGPDRWRTAASGSRRERGWPIPGNRRATAHGSRCRGRARPASTRRRSRRELLLGVRGFAEARRLMERLAREASGVPGRVHQLVKENAVVVSRRVELATLGQVDPILVSIIEGAVGMQREAGPAMMQIGSGGRLRARVGRQLGTRRHGRSDPFDLIEVVDLEGPWREARRPHDRCLGRAPRIEGPGDRSGTGDLGRQRVRAQVTAATLDLPRGAPQR